MGVLPYTPGAPALERSLSGTVVERKRSRDVVRMALPENPSTPLGVTPLVRLSGVEAFLTKVQSRGGADSIAQKPCRDRS